MAQLQVEIDDDKLELTGEVPEQIQTILKRIEETALTTGRGQGKEEAAKHAKKQIEETIAHEKAKLEASAPYDKKRVEELEAELAQMAKKLNTSTLEYERQRKSIEEQHAKDLIDRADRLEAREERIRRLTRSALRGDAMQAGAREESLDELELILAHYIGFGEDMEPFVKTPDGDQMTSQGKPVTISGFVKDYLDKHPHHRKPAPGRGGQATHGASLAHANRPVATVDAARARIEEGDRSAGAINELFEASRKKSA